MSRRHTIIVLTGPTASGKTAAGIRLAGALDAWGRVAEIWQHEDENNLSDEDDIVRVQDDYAR